MRRLYVAAVPVRFQWECWTNADDAYGRPPRCDTHGAPVVFRDPNPFPCIRIFGRTR
jgi:hypothetical protein